MNDSVIKAAIKFIKKDLKKKIDFKTVSNALKSKGYNITFYDISKKNEIIDEYGLTDFSKSVEAFTIKKKDLRIVFINSKVSAEDKLNLLLHEAGHIVLNHVDTDVLIANGRLQEIEADTFAYTVLNTPKRNKFMPLMIAAVAVIFFVTGFVLASIINKPITVTDEYDAVSIIGESSSEYVYITPSGKKYHRENCIYTTNKNCIKITKEEAHNNYEPCLVCNP